MIPPAPLFAWLDGLGGLLICGLWLCMAGMCARGNGSARVTATVLFAVAVLVVARSVYRYFRFDDVTPVGLLLFAASVLAGLAAVVLLWHRSSGPYFRADVPSR